MSGNIFASSTVPGIKDRDGDKQLVALHNQSYYLSRTSFTTAYWVKLMIGSTLLMLVVPIFLAHLFLSAIRQPQPDTTVLLSRLYPLALQPDRDRSVETDAFQLAEIPISAVLTQALAVTNGTRSRGLLAHALLELQNPELTGFAGPGYGVHLKEMNRGARLEAFPDGMVPKCGVGGRYDEWTRVRALRYAYKWIVTGEQTSLMSGSGIGSGEDGPGNGVDIDSMLMGWPALLLERAGVSDPSNPVPPGSRRNVYGEAVDRVVGKLCAEGRCEWAHDNVIAGNINSTEGEKVAKGEEKYAEGRMTVQGRSERDTQSVGDFLTFRAESVFILPPFLALYAVARQDRKWLVGAVEQIRAHFDQSKVRAYEEKPAYWMTTTAEPLPIGNMLDTEEYKSRPVNNAWTWAGIIRVLNVLEKWKPNLEFGTVEERVMYENWKKRAIYDLREMVNTVLVKLRDEEESADDILRFCGDNADTSTCKSSPRDPARTALLVSSVYRLAQLDMLDDLGLLEWVDKLYNAVARYVGKGGEMTVLSEDMEGEDSQTNQGGNEDQSMMVMMWAARRDCVKVGVCRAYKPSSWWTRLRRRSQ